MRTSIDVHNYLLERDVPHELVPLRGRLRSPGRMLRIAEVLGLPPEQVGKVVLLQAKGRLVAVLVASDREVDVGKVRRVMRSPVLRRASGERATEITEFLSEAIPPVALPEGTRVVIDPNLAEQEVLYFAGGEAASMLKIRAADLVEATGARVARVAR
jgi:prolyl-tRNA editing enzyme YbaK/EbsC (Cys-tRNA(Pro) deacylase)